jgi:hypothetical protein
MVIGDVNFVAFEYFQSNTDRKLGRVFIYINGFRYGCDEFDYELLDLAKSFSYEINEKTREYPFLLGLDAREISGLRDCILDDYELSGCEVYKSLNVSGEDIDNIFFYSPHYMFDSYGVGLVQGVEEERLYLYDEDCLLYVDIKIPRGSFYDLVNNLIEDIRRGQENQ